MSVTESPLLNRAFLPGCRFVGKLTENPLNPAIDGEFSCTKMSMDITYIDYYLLSLLSIGSACLRPHVDFTSTLHLFTSRLQGRIYISPYLNRNLSAVPLHRTSALGGWVAGCRFCLIFI